MERNVLIIIAALAVLLVIAVAVIISQTGRQYAGAGVNVDGQTPSQGLSGPETQFQGSPVGTQPAATTPKATQYKERYSFYTFQDPNEQAFTIKIPTGWQVVNGSGLIRPYIDAGVALGATSQKNQGFVYISPYAMYTTPNAILDYAGFTEGTYYDVSGGLARPMLVKRYMDARQYLQEYLDQLNVRTEVVETIDRPDLINSDPGSLITQQSAAEMTYLSNSGPNQLENKVIVYIYLVETGGTGIWVANFFGYYSPESLFNETEYLVLKSVETFKVDATWAAREAREVNKRLGIISSTQESISDTIASVFEYRSETMDRLNDDWSKAILGVEEVYDPDTGDRYIVDSGSRYYWIDYQGNIYGTDTYESPFPQENLELMECPGCGE